MGHLGDISSEKPLALPPSHTSGRGQEQKIHGSIIQDSAASGNRRRQQQHQHPLWWPQGLKCSILVVTSTVAQHGPKSEATTRSIAKAVIKSSQTIRLH